MKLSRRQFLLGSVNAFGTVACSPQARGYTAEWAGQQHERGHRLRDPGRGPAPSERRTVPVAIVGAGIAGLAAARALQRAGIDDYRLFELEDEAGGNSRAGSIMGIECSWGAHYLPLPGPAADEVAELLADFGLRRVEAGRARYDERHLCHAPQERLFIDGAWQDGVLPRRGQDAATFAEYRRFAAQVEQLREARLFAIPTGAAGWNDTLATLDGQSFAQWLAAQGFAAPALRWYLDYCCRDDYGAGAAGVSAWAGLHYFASRHGFRLPEQPAPDDDELLTWPEGNAWLARRLAAPHRERIESGVVAVRVEEQRHAVELDVLDPASGRRVRWQAQHVILATPLFVAARLLASPPPALQRAARQLASAPWLVANLYVDRALDENPRGAPLSWDNVLYGARGLGYVNALHQGTLPYHGATVLTYYLPLGDDPAAGRALLLERDLAAWCEAILDDLAPAHPDLRRKVRHVGLMRYGHGMAVPAPGIRGAAWLEPLRSAGGRVGFAHADLSGYSIFEEAYHWGLRAGTRAAARLHRGRRRAPAS